MYPIYKTFNLTQLAYLVTFGLRKIIFNSQMKKEKTLGLPGIANFEIPVFTMVTVL